MQTESSTTFLDDLLADVEQKENQNTQAYNDLIAIEVIKLENEITSNFQQAEVECNIINEWTLKRNSLIQDRANLLKLLYYAGLRASDILSLEIHNVDISNRSLEFFSPKRKVHRVIAFHEDLGGMFQDIVKIKKSLAKFWTIKR